MENSRLDVSHKDKLRGIDSAMGNTYIKTGRKEKIIDDFHPISHSIETKTRDVGSHESGALNIFFYSFKIILLLLLFAGLFRVLNNLEPLTFQSFLDLITQVPQVTFTSFADTFTIGGDWGIFEFLRSFLNVIGGIFGFLIYCVTLCAQVLLYAMYFLRWFFVL